MTRNNADFRRTIMPIEELKDLDSENFEGEKVGNLLNLKWENNENLPQVWGDDYRSLKSDIAKNGIQTPLQVSNGQLLDGHHRAVAAIELGLSHVPVVHNK